MKIIDWVKLPNEIYTTILKNRIELKVISTKIDNKIDVMNNEVVAIKQELTKYNKQIKPIIDAFITPETIARTDEQLWEEEQKENKEKSSIDYLYGN